MTTRRSSERSSRPQPASVSPRSKGIDEIPREARDKAMETPQMGAGKEPPTAGARARKGGGHGPRAVTEWRAVGVGRYRYRTLESARWTARHEASGQETGPVPGNEKRHCGRGRKVGARGERAWRRTEFRKASRY